MRQLGTFNTIGQFQSRFGGHFPVWSRVDKLYQGGGTIDTSGYDPGDVIPAGTMVKFNGPGKQVQIITSDGVTGAKEVLKLKITKGCTKNGDLLLVLNGISVEIPVTTTENTASSVAAKIEAIKAQLTEWNVALSADTVTFTQKAAKTTSGHQLIVGDTGVTAEWTVEAKGVTATGALVDVNGLIFEDVCIPDGCILATCAVAYAGRIYADRVDGGGIPASVEKQLPMIEFVHED